MSEEEMLRKLEEEKNRREKVYAKFKGFMKGIRTGRQLSPTEEDIVSLFEYMIDGFKSSWDDIITIFEIQVNTAQRINSLETRVKELQNDILQLRRTLDRMVQDK